MKYMSFIDGLRAIAVIIVFVFHLNPNWMPGGFIGVDVFFVISGFLITTILIKNIGKDKYYRHFILARCRRLVPAYLVVLIAVSLASYFLLLPNEIDTYAKSLLSASFFLSNIFFYLNSGYFDSAAEYFPLLHTWSLAVEWQYYIVYPFFIIFICRYFPAKIFLVLLATVCLSTYITVYTTNVDASLAFYITPFRAFELLLGGLVSVAVANPSNMLKKAFSSKIIVGIGALVTVVLLFYMSLNLSKADLFPGINALWISLLTAFLLLCGVMQREASWLKILQFPPLVFIGKISYSLYLWHWPVILFSKFYFGELSHVYQYVFVTTVSLILAVASWSLVENNFRIQNKENNSAIFKASFTVVMLGVAFFVGVKFTNGFENRLNQGQKDILYVKRWADFPGVCTKTQKVDKYYDCQFGDNDKAPDIFLWGDSHGQVLVWTLDEMAKHLGRSILSITKGGCPPVINAVPSSTNIEKDICLQSQQQTMNTIRNSPEIKTIVLAGRWRGYMSKAIDRIDNANITVSGTQTFDDVFTDTVRELLALGKRVVVIDSIPEPGFPVPETLTRKAMLGQEQPLTFVTEPHSVFTLLNDLEVTAGKLMYISPYNALCTDKQCNLMNNAQVLYFDSNHLTDLGVEMFLKEHPVFSE
jgi:peptidoglycan/LPS O-acetylase OafA/YrhL